MMLARFGGDAELIVESPAAYDPKTSKAVKNETRYPIRVAVFDYIKKSDGATVMTNTLIQSGDKQIIIKADPEVPEPQAKLHSVLFKGKRYNLVAVKDYDTSGETPIVYEAYGRA